MKIYTQPKARSAGKRLICHQHAGSTYRHLRRRLGNLVPLVLCLSVLALALVSGGCAIAGGSKTDNSMSVPVAPAAVTAKPGNAAVSLGWPVVADATVYHVKRSTSASGTFTQVASSASPSYTDTGLTNGTKYFYVISAANSEGESANSTPSSATPKAAATAPSPVHLNVTAGNALVNLSWTAEAGATSYHVKRALASTGAYQQIKAASSTAYTDAGLHNGTPYFYVVTAVNTAGESSNSNQVTATPAAPKPPPANPPAPATPSGLAATPGNAQVQLTWSAATNAASYNVKRATSSGGPYSIVDGALIATSYKDAAVTNGTTYYYAVSARNSAGESSNSASVSAKPVAPATASMTGESATSADQIVDSIGVNVHLHYTGTPYENFSSVQSAILGLGVRHIRDGLIDTTWAPYYDRLNQLGKAGVKSILTTSVKQSDSLLTDYPNRVSSSFEGYEAPNEYDISGDANWAATLNTFLARLHTAVKSNSRTSGYRIIGPSLTQQASYAKISGAAANFDDANIHDYFGGRNPGTPGWANNGYGSIAWNMNLAKQAWPNKSIITTETGYFNDVKKLMGIPEDVAGKYLPRVVFEQWRHGIRRTYIYELLDLTVSTDNSFGLLRPNFSHKPAYDSLKSVLNLLSDPGASFQTGKLDYTLGGDQTDVHHLLMQKRDGTFFLAVWIETPSYDVDTRSVLTVAPRTISVTTKNTTRIVAHQLDQNGAMQTAFLGHGQGDPLEISDRVVILEITP